MTRLLFVYFVGIAVFTESCVANSQQSGENVQLIIRHATIIDLQSGSLLNDKIIVIQSESSVLQWRSEINEEPG